jgi:Putative MetA-pathway of phenol degradation
MKSRLVILTSLLLVMPSALLAQTCSNTAKTDTLICSFPQLFGPSGLTLNNPAHFAHFQNASLTTFSPLSTSIGEELSTLPLGSAGSGVSFTFTPGHAPVPTEDSLGPILTERAQVIGRGNVDVGVAYQYFTFAKIDGLQLRQFPAILEHAVFQVNGMFPSYENDYITTNNNVGLHLNQSVIYAVFGLSKSLDVSAEVPIEQIHLSVTSNDHIVRTVACEFDASCVGGGATYGEYHYFGNPTSNAEALADVNATYANGGAASGIGDIILRGKYQFLRGEKTAASAGIAVRLPSGDANNFLGSGTVGVTPFGALTFKARLSPHVRVGYQWNGNSVLAGDPTSTTSPKASLPAAILYSGGADLRVVSRFTIAADLIGERVLSASRLSLGSYTDYFSSVLPDIKPYQGDYSSDSIGVGAKVRLARELILTGNVTTRIDNGGLHAAVVPLIGLSYAF